MQRPTVLHVARDWVRPSEGFVANVVRTTTATRAVVACGQRWPGSPADTVGAPVVALGSLADPDGPVGRRLPPAARRRALRAGLAAVAVARRADVLHAHLGYWAAHVEAVARRLGRPWAVSLHGHDLLVQARDEPELLAAVRRAPLVVVPSRFLADAAIARGVPPAAVRVIPAGLDLAGLPFRERRPDDDGRVVVAFAGRFVAKKGVDDAVAVLAALAAERPQVHVRFIGTGPLEARMREACASSGLDAEWVDGAPTGALRQALADTHLLLTPSRTAADGDAETLGLVNLEAQACGIPVVTTRHGGIPEAVAPDGAVLVDEGDRDAMLAALRGLVDAPHRWSALGRAGRRHVALEFELGARVADLEDQYRALAATGRPGPDPPAPRDAFPDVSVVMVTHDRRRLVAAALDALAAQTYPREHLQVVVVDNGTTDGTSADLAARADLPLHLVHSTANDPSSVARNRALAVATGQVIAFTDDDCRPVPTWIEALVAGLRVGVDVVQGRTGADPGQPLEPLSRTQWTPAEYGLYETANMAYTRRILESVATPAGPFDEEWALEVARILGRRHERYPFGEDTDLAWRAKRAGAVSRFAATAVVHHEVFPPDVSLLLHRARGVAAFPALVRRLPELRAAFLWRGIFLGSHHAATALAAVGVTAALAGRRRGLALAVPYLWQALRPTRPGRRARARALPVVVARDAVELGAAAAGSVRARTLVL